MANTKIKTEAGQGGHRGHSNMSHHTGTEEIKLATRKRRRTESKKIVAEELSGMNKAQYHSEDLKKDLDNPRFKKLYDNQLRNLRLGVKIAKPRQKHA